MIAAVGVALMSATVAGAAVTTTNSSGTILLDGQKVFPIVLAKGPPPGGITPSGADAFAEVVGAGVNFFKVGPAIDPWTEADIEQAKLENRTAAAHGAYTWINLSTVSLENEEARLEQVVTSLLADPAAGAIGMWKGRDEPLWSGIEATELRLAFCRATGRGELSWCGGGRVLDSDHLWSTIQAPRGTPQQLASYSPVTDVHGVDVYPVTRTNPNGDLSQVGRWTNTIASVTPNHAVWTTLQICASGSGDPANFVLPTRTQERFMIYDAIINGARSLAFYGGNINRCWNAGDSGLGWNWTFWNTVLRDLIAEISAISPIAPALVNAETTQVMSTSDSTTQAIARAGNGDDLWVIAARTGTGTQSVTISGLPASVANGAVYTENRTITAANGSFTDTFAQWGVHVYRFVPQSTPPPQPPTIASVAPASGPVGTLVTITGTNLAATTGVTFGGTQAGFTVTSASEVSATVPVGAFTGAISVTTLGGTATSSSPFTVVASSPPLPPPPPGGGGSGGQALPPDLRLVIDAQPTSNAVGGTSVIAITAVDAGGGASRVTLTISLSAALALVGPPHYERGSGCAGSTTIVCDLDFLVPNAPTRIRFSVRATAAGEQRITAGITSRETDANAADNSASATIAVTAPPLQARAPSAQRRATQGPDRLVGTARADRLFGLGGADRLLGLGGNDVLDGGPGNDTLTGGAGRDRLHGRAGNDVLNARDGRRDRVVCGPGRDYVLADRADSVARDCERVRRL